MTSSDQQVIHECRRTPKTSSAAAHLHVVHPWSLTLTFPTAPLSTGNEGELRETRSAWRNPAAPAGVSGLNFVFVRARS